MYHNFQDARARNRRRRHQDRVPAGGRAWPRDRRGARRRRQPPGGGRARSREGAPPGHGGRAGRSRWTAGRHLPRDCRRRSARGRRRRPRHHAPHRLQDRRRSSSTTRWWRSWPAPANTRASCSSRARDRLRTGEDAAGRAARSGGWGYLLGDEGGGFWIGRAALSAVVRQFDGRGPATLLTEMVLDHMSLGQPDRADPRDLLSRRAPADDRRPRVARADGRWIAATPSPATSSRAPAPSSRPRPSSVITRLGMRGDAFPTVLAGGIFRGRAVAGVRRSPADLRGGAAERSPAAGRRAGGGSRSPGHRRRARARHGAVVHLAGSRQRAGGRGAGTSAERNG